LISYSIPITSFSILDFRHLIEILVAILGGIIPAIITGTIDALYRLTFNGVNQSSIIASVGILVLTIGCGLISLINISRNNKIAAMLFYSLTIRSLVYYLLIENKKMMLDSILILWFSSIIIGAGVYYLVQYLITSIKLTHSLKKTSDIDFLTGLNNTRAFNYNYSRLLISIVEEKKPLSFLMIDIDHFKKINNTYGHIAGDEILREFGTVGNIKNLKEIADNKLYEAKKTGRNKVCI
ncbi:MAG TPA: diguanylate cyclase, partial [Clostridia bacterium]|nr:diguanylate cyclase [Clostridia bacterium]